MVQEERRVRRTGVVHEDLASKVLLHARALDASQRSTSLVIPRPICPFPPTACAGGGCFQRRGRAFVVVVSTGYNSHMHKHMGRRITELLPVSCGQ